MANLLCRHAQLAQRISGDIPHRNHGDLWKRGDKLMKKDRTDRLSASFGALFDKGDSA